MESPPTHKDVKVGDVVTVSGLTENKHLNGLKGKVKSIRRGRYEVLAASVGISYLFKPEHIGAGTSIWIPIKSPALARQTSFEQVRLVRQQSLEKRRRAKEFINMLSKPFSDLTAQEDAVKHSLFIRTEEKKGQPVDIYLLSALPSVVQKLSIKALSLVLEYSDLSFARLSMEKRGLDLYNFIQVRRKLSIASGASLDQLTADKLVQEKVRSKLRNLFGSQPKAELAPEEENSNENEWDWDWDDYEDGDDGGGEEGYDPSDTAAKTKEVLPNGLSYLELGIVLECLNCFYQEISGTPWKESSDAEVIDLSQRAKAKQAAQTFAGKGYTGNQGETKATALLMEKKKLEDLIRDQVSGILMGAICITIKDLSTSNKLDLPHLSLLSESCLNPILGLYLRNSFMQIAERQGLYLNLLKAIEVLANENLLRVLLFAKKSRHTSLYQILSAFRQQVELYLKTPDKGTDKETLKLVESAQEFDRILATVDLQAKAFLKEEKKKEAKSGKKLTKEEKQKAQTILIQKFLKSHAIDFVDLQNSPIKHKFLSEAKQSPANSKLSSRLAGEVGSMTSGLPPGIFVRVDSRRMDIMRVCINGPAQSPYENGMFFFDVFFPYNYPAVPPKMKIITTGRATFRFNANLYTNGKYAIYVHKSNIELTAFVRLNFPFGLSFQAMILGTDEPIANEPGWERDKGTSKSKRYNSILSHGTMLYAMYEHIKSPPDGFKEIVNTHFWEHKDHLLKKQLPTWKKAIEKAGDSGAGPYREENLIHERISVTYKNLTKAMQDLRAPQFEMKEEEEEESDDDDF
ncbi:hypothetical protein AAMO2058_000913900 [Amorphochlora amoebiformis]